MRVRLVISLFLVSIAPHDASSTSSSNLRVTGGSTESRKKRTRWEPLEAAASLHSQRHEPLLAPPITTISTNRRACSVYLWDALSAAKYHLCRRLLRDCVYEGMGGRRFVRIEPGTLLQLLYPLKQHSPDKCVVCGGNVRDHFTLWWSKHNLYTPFDLNLDKVRERGSFVREEIWPEEIKRSKRFKRQNPPVFETIYSFHQSYVFDLGMFLQIGSQTEHDKKEKLRQADSKLEPFGPLEVRTLKNVKTTYVVPSIRTDLGLDRLLVKFARSIALGRIDELIAKQVEENAL